MADPHAGRLLFHRDGESAWNMAVDQAIAESVSGDAQSGSARPYTLRFYTWAAPTLSLGYFQSSGDASPRFDTTKRVRRSTGGGAILHHHELTYSLTVPSSAGEHGARTDLYRGVHAAIINALHRQGIDARPHYLNKTPAAPPRAAPTLAVDEDPFLCFQRRTDEDLIVSGYKVLGSAQRRFKRSLLQHGSLLLRASEYASELPGLVDLTSIALNPETFLTRISEEFEALSGVAFQSDVLSAAEATRADEIVASRFGRSDWWARR
ncbi:Octanoyltransferase LipM [Stieleria neptunia]|uniref:Octanoyltransferase LipM n=1 Tax=Stieleria neptunia TaxID=2527979 RepID=A0A518I1Q4_9BACT|nr:biotin/lipoate A/B protein ligase family protein [Stieleria neptunia]QDV46964.1 Octanoyltransferase LipM [Stieleria neptunia]